MSGDRCKNCSRLIIAEESTTCKKCGKPLHKDCAVKTRNGHFCDVCFETKEETIEHPKLPQSIRRSYLDEYESCPYSAYLDIVKGIELPGSSFAEVGITLHETFDMFYQELHEPTEKMLIDDFKRNFEMIKNESFEFGLMLFKEKTLEQHKEDMYNVGLTSISNFLKLNDEHKMVANRRLIETEKKIVFSIGEEYPEVQITLDRLDEVDGELELIDYKTGNVMVGRDLQDNLQVPLYIYAVEQHYKRPVKRFVLHYLNDDKVRIYNRVDDDTFRCDVRGRWYIIKLSTTIQRVKVIFDNMKKGKWSVPTDFKSMYFKCKTCSKKHYGYCDGAESQVWKTVDEFKW